MTTLAEVRAELADICATIPGWRSSGWVGDSITEPMIKVARPAFDPRLVFGSDGKKSVTFQLTAYVKRADTERAEKMLDALAEPSGSGSLIAAVQTSSNWSRSTAPRWSSPPSSRGAPPRPAERTRAGHPTRRRREWRTDAADCAPSTAPATPASSAARRSPRTSDRRDRR